MIINIVIFTFFLLCFFVSIALAVRLSDRWIPEKARELEDPSHLLAVADQRAKIVLEEAETAAKELFSQRKAHIEETHSIAFRLLMEVEKELDVKSNDLDILTNEMDKLVEIVQEKEFQLNEIKSHIKHVYDLQKSFMNQYSSALEQKAGGRRDALWQEISEDCLANGRLGASRWLMEQADVFKQDAYHFSQKVLNTVLDRYSPTFIWPKSNLLLSLPSLSVAQKYFSEGSSLIQTLLISLETHIEVVYPTEGLPQIKCSGGSGVDRELARMVLDEVISRGAYTPDKIMFYLSKYRRQMDRQLVKLGNDAAKILGLKALHPEILRLIGSLNYRTSHRQNQFFHSIEVARLAGMIADELGVDRHLAKRSGLLHDIGKALDYKIEGSHAVISADYATRYGEDEDVVDTVLAHHDDKIVETPHAFILKAADAMSGARPGARVDVEEGYLKRLEGIQEVVEHFYDMGVAGSAVMHAGREVHIFVDNKKVNEHAAQGLASEIARKLEADVQFPGQIRVTVFRRLEITEVA